MCSFSARGLCSTEHSSFYLFKGNANYSAVLITPGYMHGHQLFLLFLTCMHTELWRAPSLQTVNAADNLIATLSPEIIRAQTLTKLIFDTNHLTCLPSQLLMLENLYQISVCGNQIKNLPNVVTDLRQMKLRKIYVDGNQSLQLIPESLLVVPDWGLFDCPVRVMAEEIDKAVCVHTCKSSVPSLLELVARSLHVFLRGGYILNL